MDRNDKRIQTMEQARPTEAVLKMGLPVTAGMLFMIAYNLVDTYFIGRLNDELQLAAVNLAYPVMIIMIAIAGLVGNGAASYLARCMGAGKTDEACHTLTLSFEMVVVSGAVIAGLGLILLDPFLKLLGTSEFTYGYTKDYVSVMLIGSVFTMGNYAVGQLLRSEGSTMLSMTGMIIGNLVNIVLDPVFIFTLGMEVKGAAAATVIGNAVGLIIYLFCYAAGRTLLRPEVRFLRFDGMIFREIMLVGIPHTLEQFFMTASMIVINNLSAAYGDIHVAAMGVANKIMTCGSYVYQGMAAGCQPLLGYNFGAGNYSRLRSIIKAGIGVTTAMELAIMAAFAVFAPQLIGIFSDSDELIAIGAHTLRLFMLTLPFVSAVSIVRNTFNSIGKPMYAFSITVFRQCILYIPLMLLMNRLWAYTGLVLAHAVEEFITSIGSLILLFGFLKKTEG